jgi:SAM-dependent methyltransferase
MPSARTRISRLFGRPREDRVPKGEAELRFWRDRYEIEGSLQGPHYERFFTTHFHLDRDFFRDKRLLDIGCGPRGSLEWADMAAERVGLDPLVDDYRELGIDSHSMSYVGAGAEAIPFTDGHFDVVSALNALDHVDDLDAVIAEITRVTRSGGNLLLIVEVGHTPTPTEPQTLTWDVLDRFVGWEVAWRKRNAMLDEIYGSLDADLPHEAGHGLLSARLTRD